MKILFVIHDLDFADHIALSYLSAVSKQLGHSSYLCNLNTDDLSESVSSIKPDVVAFSVNVIGVERTINAHKEASKIHKYISIMGGPHPTYSPETFGESGMDAYCVGEGEYAFKDFLLCVEKGQPFDDVPNLITHKKNNPARPLIKNLDELPFPDRHLILSNTFLKNTPKKTFYATRGCPFKCAYCSNNYFHELYKGKGPIVRRFSVGRLIAEIEDVKQNYRMEFIKFGDDLFAMRADQWLKEFAEQYSKRINIPFNCFLRIDRVNDDVLKLLKKAGCFSVHLSVDSVSKKVREEVLNRNMLDIDIVATLKKIQRYGIHTWVNYMLAAPESTIEDDLETIRLSRRAGVTYPAYSTTVPMKGTRLYDYCIEHKYLDSRTHKSDMNGCYDRSELVCFSDKEKDIRYNVFLLGAFISKLPFPLFQMAMWSIKILPPNNLFKRVRKMMYSYYIENKIFLLKKQGASSYGNNKN